MNDLTHPGYPTLDELIAHVQKYHPNEDMGVIERAYRFAENAHKDQKRMSGEPYFAHPALVALILAYLMLDPPTIAAGLPSGWSGSWPTASASGWRRSAGFRRCIRMSPRRHAA